MDVSFRLSIEADVPKVISLLADDALGAVREVSDLAAYLEAYRRMQQEGAKRLIIGELSGDLVATYQLTFISGLSHRATRRAQIESVRVRSDLRGQGVGTAMMRDAEARAREAGCRLIQLTTHATRNRARDFYDSIGYTPSHVGYKKVLD